MAKTNVAQELADQRRIEQAKRKAEQERAAQARRANRAYGGLDLSQWSEELASSTMFDPVRSYRPRRST